MAGFMLDTNICIYIRQKRSPSILRRLERLRPTEACISTITFGELRYGAEKSRQAERALALLTELIALLPVMPLPVEAAAHYGEIRADLERRGMVIGNNDLWIAAHARSRDATLVTNNAREFLRVAGLKVENWTAD
jgi:tRNA(fMet)-specific endonuclease VapC